MSDKHQGRDENDPVSDGNQEVEGYEQEEARLQQERLEYLQQQLQSESNDAEVARQIQNDEMLQTQRQEICRQLQDEELARRMQADEQQRGNIVDSAGQSVDGCINTELDSRLLSPESIPSEYDDVLLLSTGSEELTQDEELAAALQRFEQEEVDSIMQQRAEQELISRDAYLARIMQNTERISAIRRSQNSNPTSPVPAVSPSQMPAASNDNSLANQQQHSTSTTTANTSRIADASPQTASDNGRHRCKCKRKPSCKQQ